MGPEISVAHFVNFWIYYEINCFKLEAQKLLHFIGFEFSLWKGFSFTMKNSLKSGLLKMFDFENLNSTKLISHKFEWQWKHIVENKGYFCHSDFMWNQIWCILRLKYCKSLSFWYSGISILENVNAKRFFKILKKYQSLWI